MINQFKIKIFIIITLITIIIISTVLSFKLNPKPSIVNQASQEKPIVPNIQIPDEKLLVENYIKDNITTIATNQPVLGGTWYVVSINVSPETKTGQVIYEDGHIQSIADITYTYENNPQVIMITKFDVKK